MLAFGEFINPALLWLAAGALVPIVIHLAMRSKPKQTPFPAVRFIMASYRQTSAHFRLRQLLLLMMRIAALVFFALVLARPWTKGDASENLTQAKTTLTAVILLDNSYSMGAHVGDATAFENAKQMALAALDVMNDDSRICLLLVADTPVPVMADFKHAFDLGAVRDKIRTAELSARKTDCTAAVNQAIKMLEGVHGVGKSIFLFTDLTANSWPERPASIADDIAVHIIDARPEEISNAAVIRVQPPADAAPGVPLEIAAEVLNAGRERKVELLINGERRAVRNTGIRLIETVHLTAATPRSAENFGVVAIDADALDIDNTWYFTFRNAPRSRIILVNGAPSALARRDELYFLRIALAPSGLASEQLFELVEVSPEKLETSELDADVVALGNAPPLSVSAWTKLRHFVSTGRGLVILGGDNIVPQSFEPALGELPLLPCNISDAVEPQNGTRLEQGKLAHPMLRVFRDGRNGDLAAAKFSKHLALVPNNQGEIVLRFESGAPAVVAGGYGTGRVIVFASTCDMDWTDLPREIPFVVLMNEMMKFAAGGAADSNDVRVGDSPSLKVDNATEVSAAQMRRLPDGKPDDMTRHLDVRRARLDLPAIDSPGIYEVTLKRASGAEERRLFAANLDTSESDVRKLSDDEVKALSPARPIFISKSEEQLLASISRGEIMSELTSHLAGIVLAVLLVEMYLSNHMRARAS